MLSPLPPLLTENADAIARLCRQHGVQRLEVFGSAADGRFDTQRSDFDLIVTFASEARPSMADHCFALAEGLECLLGRKVDLLTDQPIRNPYLRRAVNASRRDLYVRSAAPAAEAGVAPYDGIARMVAAGMATWSGEKPAVAPPIKLPPNPQSMSDMVIQDRG